MRMTEPARRAKMSESAQIDEGGKRRRTCNHRERQDHLDVDGLPGFAREVGRHDASDDGHTSLSDGQKLRLKRSEAEGLQSEAKRSRSEVGIFWRGREEKRRAVMTMFPNADAPPDVKHERTCSRKSSQTAGSSSASTSWYRLKTLFCKPDMLGLTRSTSRTRVSAGQHLALMGLSGRNQPTKQPQRTVTRPRSMNKTCQLLRLGLSMWETPYASRPPT